MSEPVRDYEIIDNINTSVTQLLGTSPSLSKMVNSMLERSVNGEKKGKIEPFDALITSDGDNAILIKFKEGGFDQKGIRRVNKMLGKEVYIMSEPLKDYETVDKVNSAFSQGLGVSPSIENMIKTMVEKSVNKESKGKVGDFDAIITSDGDNAILVSFK